MISLIILVCLLTSGGFALLKWRGYNFAIADLAVHEYAGILRYYIYNLLGWNPRVSRSASP
jgi:hypothetical protein